MEVIGLGVHPIWGILITQQAVPGDAPRNPQNARSTSNNARAPNPGHATAFSEARTHHSPHPTAAAAASHSNSRSTPHPASISPGALFHNPLKNFWFQPLEYFDHTGRSSRDGRSPVPAIRPRAASAAPAA